MKTRRGEKEKVGKQVTTDTKKTQSQRGRTVKVERRPDGVEAPERPARGEAEVLREERGRTTKPEPRVEAEGIAGLFCWDRRSRLRPLVSDAAAAPRTGGVSERGERWVSLTRTPAAGTGGAAEGSEE
ncbi:hypothetical protein HDU96_005286, partial [Phlyctochytrium bullatum]